MIQWTTPTLRLTVRGADLTGTDVHATIKQSGRDPIEGEVTSVTYDDEANATVVLADFTQAQTGGIRRGEATARAANVDQNNSKVAVKGELWRVAKDSCPSKCFYQNVVDIFNDTIIQTA